MQFSRRDLAGLLPALSALGQQPASEAPTSEKKELHSAAYDSRAFLFTRALTAT